MWLINADGTGNRRVRDHDDGTEEAVGHESWANTEKKLFYKIRRKSEGKIYIACFDVDANQETVLTECPHNHGIATADDRYFVADCSDGPMRIVDLKTMDIRYLCHPNMTWRKGWSRFHPHPTSSNKGDRIVYSTDAYGANPGVFVVDIPKE
jgi:Tol biopolymer transport system component